MKICNRAISFKKPYPIWIATDMGYPAVGVSFTSQFVFRYVFSAGDLVNLVRPFSVMCQPRRNISWLYLHDGMSRKQAEAIADINIVTNHRSSQRPKDKVVGRKRPIVTPKERPIYVSWFCVSHAIPPLKYHRVVVRRNILPRPEWLLCCILASQYI